MTTEKAEVKQQGKGAQKAKGQGGQPKQNKAQQRAEQQQRKLERKMTRAAQPDTAVVSRKALETNAMVALLGQNDYFITQLRNKVGYDPKIDVSKAMNLLQINGAIRNVVAIANAAMQHTLGMTYEPPRGLEVTKLDPAKLELEKILEGLQAIVTAAEATAPAETAKPAEIRKAA